MIAIATTAITPAAAWLALTLKPEEVEEAWAAAEDVAEEAAEDIAEEADEEMELAAELAAEAAAEVAEAAAEVAEEATEATAEVTEAAPLPIAKLVLDEAALEAAADDEEPLPAWIVNKAV